MENKTHWEHFRENWQWTSFYHKDGTHREKPTVIALKDMETDHIIRCMLYSITYGFIPNTNNMAVLLTELLYRNEQ